MKNKSNLKDRAKQHVSSLKDKIQVEKIEWYSGHRHERKRKSWKKSY